MLLADLEMQLSAVLADPAHAPGTEEEQFAVFRRVRDEIARTFRAYAAGRLDEAKCRARVDLGI